MSSILPNTKKAISPIIATVLLITLAMMLAGFVLMWMTTFVSDKIEVMGKPVDEVCKDVPFDVAAGNYDAITKNLSIQIVNRANVDIKGVEIKFIKERESYLNKYMFDALIAEASSVQVIPVESDVVDIIIYPIIVGSVVGKKLDKPISCIYSGKTIRLARLEGVSV